MFVQCYLVFSKSIWNAGCILGVYVRLYLIFPKEFLVHVVKLSHCQVDFRGCKMALCDPSYTESGCHKLWFDVKLKGKLR